MDLFIYLLADVDLPALLADEVQSGCDSEDSPVSRSSGSEGNVCSELIVSTLHSDLN
jgi:hypothetical protein